MLRTTRRVRCAEDDWEGEGVLRTTGKVRVC